MTVVILSITDRSLGRIDTKETGFLLDLRFRSSCFGKKPGFYLDAQFPIPDYQLPKIMKNWKSILLYIGVAYIVLLLGPIAGFDLPKIIGEIISSPEVLIQQLLVGLVNGALIAIIALGYTMVYGIIELINFAHGDLYMLGAFASLTVFGAFGIQDGADLAVAIPVMLVALIVCSVFCAGLNIVVEKYAYRPLRNAPRLAPLISAIGVSFIFQNMGLFWGGLKAFIPVMGSNSAAPKSFPDLLPRIDILKAMGIQTTIVFTTKDLIVLVVALVLMILLHVFVQYTRLGKAMRATAQSRDAAKIMGIKAFNPPQNSPIFWNINETPIAEINGAKRGALRNGR